MTRTNLFGASALVGLAMLFGQTFALAQAGGQPQPPAPPSGSQSQPDAAKKNEQPKPDAAKPADKPKPDAAKPAEKPKPDAPSSDKPSATPKTDKSDRPVDPQTTDRNRADKPNDSKDAKRPESDRGPSREPADRDQPKSDKDRSDARSRDRAGAKNDDAKSDDAKPDDRSRQNADRSQRRSDAKVTPKDLGFGFASQATDRGLKIDKLSAKSIASRADFHEGDIIVSVNDHRVRSQNEFIRFIDLDARDRITVIVLRDDREVTLYLDPTVIYEEVVVTSAGGWLGVDLEDRQRRAAVVHRVHPDSPAERAGLKAGDMILAVEGTEIRSPEHLGEVIGGMRPGSDVEIEVDRNRRSMFVDATLGEKKEVATRRTEIR